MARAKRTPAKPVPENRMGTLLEEFLAWMRVRNTAEYTQYHRRACVARFIRWASECGIADPMEVTRPILENYQHYLYYHRQKNGEPLTFRTQYSWLVPVRTWFRWLAKNDHILNNPASDLEMPKVEKRLPRAVLSEEEAESVMQQPDICEPIGLRDRAILAVAGEQIQPAGSGMKLAEQPKHFDADVNRKIQNPHPSQKS